MKDATLFFIGCAIAVFLFLLKYFAFEKVCLIVAALCIIALFFKYRYMPTASQTQIQPKKKKKKKAPNQIQEQRLEVIEFNGKRFIEYR